MPFSAALRQEASQVNEQVLRQQIAVWQKAPSKALTTQLLASLTPIIQRAMSAHVGGDRANPLLRSRARRMALDALRRYDPAQAKPSTYLYGQLAGLRRVARQQQQILAIPEQASLARVHLQRAEADLQDSLGRDPSDDELADRLGLSVRRIHQVKGYKAPLAEGQFTQMDDEGGGFYSPGVARQDSRAWLDVIRTDLDPVNQQIMDHTLGLYGRPTMSNQDLAAKLKLSPGAISQRKGKIQQKLDLEGSLSPF